MGKKSPPQPFLQPISSVPDSVDRKDLDNKSKKEVRETDTRKTSTKDGKAAPQASLLAERDFWKKKESLLKE